MKNNNEPYCGLAIGHKIQWIVDSNRPIIIIILSHKGSAKLRYQSVANQSITDRN